MQDRSENGSELGTYLKIHVQFSTGCNLKGLTDVLEARKVSKFPVFGQYLIQQMYRIYFILGAIFSAIQNVNRFDAADTVSV